MRHILIGAAGSTAIALKAMMDAGMPPTMLATFDPEIGPLRHADYVDLARISGADTEILHIDNVNDASFIARVAAIEPDVIFVIGWSQVISPALRQAAKRFCVGFHPTALPQLRGRAALGWTILLGLKETGSSLFIIDDEVDNGPILAQTRFPLTPRETLTDLVCKQTEALARMVRDVLPKIADGSIEASPQLDEGVTYGSRRTAADHLIDWSCPADEVDRLIRASTRPYSGAFTFTLKRRVTIWRAEPVHLPWPHYGAAGQIVTYSEHQPIVRCGDGGYLLITEYECEGESRPLAGQVRLRRRPAEEWE